MGKFQKGFSGESVQISLYCTLFLEVEVPSLSLSFGAVSFRCYVVSARNMMEWRLPEKRRRLEEMDVRRRRRLTSSSSFRVFFRASSPSFSYAQ